MVRASDDRVYVAGLADGNSRVPYFIVRLTSDGEIDSTFGVITLAERWESMTPHLDGLVIGIDEKLHRYRSDGSLDEAFKIADPEARYYGAAVDHDGNLFALATYSWLHQLGLDGALVARKESVWGERDSLYTGLDGRLYLEDDWLDQWLAGSLNQHDTRYMRVRQIPDDWSEEVKQPVEIVSGHSYIPYGTYNPLKGWARSDVYGKPRNVFADPTQSVFSSTVDSDGNIFVALIDLHGYALKKKTLGQSSGFDSHYSTGAGPDHFSGLPAMKLHPAGAFIYVAGDFATFDGHASPRLARLHLDPPDPPDIPTKTKPRVMIYRPKGKEIPQDSVYELEVVVMGSPPFSAFLGRTEVSPLVGGGEIVSESHARDGVFQFRFKTPADPSVIPREGAWGLHIEIIDRFSSTVYLPEAYGRITWAPSQPYVGKVTRSIHYTGKIELKAEVYGSERAISWTRDGEVVPGETGSTLLIDSEPENSGNYQCVVTNPQGSVRSDSLAVVIASSGAGWPRMANVSLRALSRSGEEAIIMGVVADGPRTLAARAVGPSLAPLGVADPLPDPLIKVFTAESALLGWADDLKAESYTQSLGAFPLVPGSPEASLLVDLQPDRPKTLQAVDARDRSGNVLVEAYVQEDGGGRIRNISERAWVKGSEATAIAGFVLSDADDFKMLIRAAGPSLNGYGVAGFCPDPSIELYRLGEDTPFASNNDWSDGVNPDELTATFSQAGAFVFEPGSLDAALRVTLGPGAYTAVARCADGAEGVVLLEVYDLTED